MDIITEFEKLAKAKVSELLEVIRDSCNERAGDVPENIKFLLDGADNLDCVPIGIDDGLINYIFRISSRIQTRSVVIKWARLTPKIEEIHDIGIGKHEYSNILCRNSLEAQALGIIDEFVPGSTAQLYWKDSTRNFFIMEDLSDYVTLKQQLNDGLVIEEVFLGIGRFMSDLHSSTHCTVIPEGRKEEMMKTFYDEGLIKIANKWFAETFRSDNEAAAVRPRSAALDQVLPGIIDDPEIQAINEMIKVSMKDINICFLHNDTHPGFVMINKDNKLKFIDAELAKYGNPPKDVGYFLGEVIVWYYVNLGRGKADVCARIREYVGKTVNQYVSDMGDLITDFPEFMHYLSAHAGHFAGVRTVNLMRFPQFEGLEQAEAKCAQVATSLMKGHHAISTVDQFVDRAFLTHLSIEK